MKLLARSRGLTVSALVRLIVAKGLEAEAPLGVSSAPQVPALASSTGVELPVGLRMPAHYASLLARTARAAEISQGNYVAQLLDGHPPPPVAPDQRENRSALVQSNAGLATLSSDVQALIRLLRQSGSPESTQCLAALKILSERVVSHLAIAAPLLATMKATRTAFGCKSDL